MVSWTYLDFVENVDNPNVDLLEITELDISKNYLDELPYDIGNLINLKVFDCSNNKIENLDGIMDLPFLEKLNCSNNNLDGLPLNI